MHRLCATLFVVILASAATAQNTPPATPTIQEPAFQAQIVHPADVHMDTAAFSDPDPGDSHFSTDWQILAIPNQVVWQAVGVTGPTSLHAHLGDGTFIGPLAGADQLEWQTAYTLRVRHRDDSGDPATEYSPWASRIFVTAAPGALLPLELTDIADNPAPTWVDPNGSAVDLTSAPVPQKLRIETETAQLLLEITAAPGPGNTVTNPLAISHDEPVRVVIDAGATAVSLPETNLTIVEQGCDAETILLPAVTLGPFQVAYFWVARGGGTFIGTASQTTPNLTQPARALISPWIATEPGYSVELVASGFTLPVNIAFVPNPGPDPGDPKFYVTELYGTIKTVTNDGSVVTYANNLLNYTPSGAFPGAGEQGLTGIAVDPVTGDVFAAMLNDDPGPGLNGEPRVDRFTSTDGGLTFATRTNILYMPGEYQGQSHQISRLEIVDGELFCHMGDGFVSSTAQNLGSFRGKILRMDLNGNPLPTNPHYDGAPFTARDYVFARGVRNPFGGAWRAADDERYMVENGPVTDRFAKLVSGRNYLWNGSDSQMTNFALYNWFPASGPVNLAFVQPETFGGSGFPADKQGHAFVSESGATYASGVQSIGKRITEWVLDASGNLQSGPSDFVEYVGAGRATMVGLAAGPDGLYFTELYKDDQTTGPTATGARVFRVRFGSSDDCDASGEPDWCEIATGLVPDCNGNTLPDSCDIAAGTSTDFDGNGVPDECDALSEDSTAISLATGGTINFTLDAGPAYANMQYWLVGGSTGTSPGVALSAGAVLPLNIANDPWFLLTLQSPNSVVLINTFSTLDANGRNTAALTLPTLNPPLLAGWQLHHAFVIYDPAVGFVYASNPVPATLTL